MTRRIPAAALAAALGLLLTGCGGGGTVTGTVALDGSPVKHGTVTFHPVGGGPAAIGAIADGKYELAVGKDRSVPAGDYVVTVDASEPVSSETPADPRKSPAPPKRLTPAKYANKDTTDLKATVKSGTNVIPLELKGGK